MRENKISFAKYNICNLGHDFLEKYWDYEKNTEDPWNLSYGSGKKVFIYCQDQQYHGSYSVVCRDFSRGARCSYCKCRTIHPKDSFAQWGIDTFGEDFLEKYWDFKKNTEDPWNLSKTNKKKIWIFCQNKEYHSSYIISCGNFYIGNRCGYCQGTKIHPKDSFAQWGIDTLGEDFLEKYWDYEKNTEDPWLLTKSNVKKIYIKCQEKDYHSSYTITCSDFHRGYRCNYCSCKIIHPKDSFAQWGIDTLGEDFLEKYWDYEKNTEDPWLITKSNNRKIYIICQEKDYHGCYKTSCASFYRGIRCNYCRGFKIHPKDSFAQWGIDKFGVDFLEKYWDYDKNNQDPWNISRRSGSKAWFKCPNHDSYERIIDNVSRSELRCPECVRERDESFLQEKVRIFLSNLGYTTKHEYNCSLQPINPKTNHPLRYDNEVQELRLIIEVHGLQHYEFIETWHRTRKEFREYKWRDQFKKNYALKENFHYLEIPYWEEYEDKYKETIIKKIKEILKERL